MAKEIVKNETLVIWILLCAGIAVPLVLADSLLVWVLHDCWPIRTSWIGGCAGRVPGYAWHLAVVFGSAFVIGSALAWRLLRTR